jgi:hypothetical protein
MSAVAIDQIVKELCVETGEPGLQNYDTLLGKVLDGVRDLNIFNLPTWTATTVTLNNYNAICWPKGTIKPLMVVMERNGHKVALAVTSDIIDTIGDTSTDAQMMAASDEIDSFFLTNGSRDIAGWFPIFNWGLGEVYGLNTGYTVGGIVTHDKSRRQSFVRNIRVQDGDKFYFLAKADGLDALVQQDLCVPGECKEAIEYFALSKYFRTRNPNLASVNQENYRQQFYRLQRYNDTDDENAWVAMMLASNRSSPKY